MNSCLVALRIEPVESLAGSDHIDARREQGRLFGVARDAVETRVTAQVLLAGGPHFGVGLDAEYLASGVEQDFRQQARA